MSTTSFDLFYTRFFNKVEKDADFFDYYNHTEEESMEIAKQRAENYLIEAVDELKTKCETTVNFYDMDMENKCFNFKAYSNEIEIISRIMFKIYLERDIALMKPIVNSLSATDIKALFSPAADRKTFDEMLKRYESKTDTMISQYTARDRETGKRRTLKYES